MGSHCNNYGFSGGFAALCAFGAFYIIQQNKCRVLGDAQVDVDHLQMFHFISMIVGGVLFVLSFFNFAGVLYEVALLFYAAALAIFASGGMMLYGTYNSFYINCKGAVDQLIGAFAPKSVFENQDQIGISVMMLDLLCGLMLITAAISFSRHL